MARLISELAFIALIFCIFGGIAIMLIRQDRRSPKKPSAPDVCKHKRWTRWKTEKVSNIHVYSEVDEGRGLPDRVDVHMTRECLECGLPQARTVRGIDSPHFK